MNKQTLRALFLEKRLTLTPNELKKRNKQLLKNCQQFIEKLTSIEHAHIFVSMADKNEPDTLRLIDWLIEEKNTKVYSSKTFYKERKLSHHQILHSNDFMLGRKGIPEPVNPKKSDPQLMDLVFIPLISFDETGNRIGYGAGLYDRFLSEVRPDCLKVGLALTPPLNNIDYVDSLDIPLDYCINHLGIYSFDRQ